MDGGGYGPFDGAADSWDWTFNQTGYEGAIALTFNQLDRRVVWEYNLSSVTLTPPVSATLTFTIRGAAVWPPRVAEVNIYSYPSDLLETSSDFNSGPTVLQGTVNVEGTFPPPTLTFDLDVSTVVSSALASGADKVAFRFQINPGTTTDNSQAFIDALDSDPTTKPRLLVGLPPDPADIDRDGDVDMLDVQAFIAVLLGSPLDPSHVARCDLSQDGAADGADTQFFVQFIVDG